MKNYASGGGLVFGPYFIRNRPYNSAEYVRLLQEEVLPDIHGVIGAAAFNMATWMQVRFELTLHLWIFSVTGRCSDPHLKPDHGIFGWSFWGQSPVGQGYQGTTLGPQQPRPHSL